jgi:Putative transposase
MRAYAVDIGPSLTTRAEIGTVPSARLKRASVGWRPMSESSSPPATSMLCSLCLMNSMCWPWTTRLFYDLLFTASAQTLLEIAADPKHLGAKVSVISILHTWGQNLLLHPHIHCAIPAGGISLDRRRWIRPRYPFFLPVRILSRVFRGKFLAGLKRLYRDKKFACPRRFRSRLATTGSRWFRIDRFVGGGMDQSRSSRYFVGSTNPRLHRSLKCGP